MIKKLVKLPLKLVYRATGPVRRPLVRAFENWIDRYVVMTSHAAVEEANIGLDFAAAELVRMRRQVEALRAEVERTESLSVVA